MPLKHQDNKKRMEQTFAPWCLRGTRIVSYLFSISVSSLLLVSTPTHAQEKDAKALIQKVIDKFNEVQSYEADVVIDTKIFFLNILPQKAHLSFKQPDIFKVKSTGISLLPKQNFDNIYSVLRKQGDYDAFITGNEKSIVGITTIVNVIPNTDTTDLILAKLWMDEQENIIRKVQLTTRANGTILIEYDYKNHIQYALPDKVIFTVDVKKFKIPKAIAADINSPVKTPVNTKNEKKGKIIITFKDYKIN